MPAAREPEWIRPGLRPLPVIVVPAHRETLDSYLARLAAANRLDRGALRAHIAGDDHRTAPLTLARLATASSQPVDVLRRAIPELGLPARPARFANHPGPPYGSSRRECWRCAASRGRSRPATVHALHHEAVCRRHRQWLGDACVDSDDGQPNLARHPQIIRANRQHRRLVRRHGLNPTTTAYRDAAWTCRRWHHDRDHDQEFVDLLTGFHGPSWNLTITDATIQAARYPQIVALTRLLASPYWRAKADQANPVEFVAEVQRTIASRYIWTVAGPHRRFDPLVETLGHHLRPVDVQQGASIGQ